jgi:hypothetical protein
MDLNLEAFSANQISSKLWAAEELEKVVTKINFGSLNLYMLGGWYALLHFILKTRNNIHVDECRSIDIDPMACNVANSLNVSWERDWKFKAFPEDANTIQYPEGVNCIINTSSEHMESDQWFENIKPGMLCLIQSNNLDIPEHTNIVASARDLQTKYPLTETLFSGTRPFKTYQRFMSIGIK